MNNFTDLDKAKLSYFSLDDLRNGVIEPGPSGPQGLQGPQGPQGPVGEFTSAFLDLTGIGGNQDLVQGASLFQYMSLVSNQGDAFAWIPGNPGSLTCVTPGLYLFHFYFNTLGVATAGRRFALKLNDGTLQLHHAGAGEEGGSDCLVVLHQLVAGDVITLISETLAITTVSFAEGDSHFQIVRVGGGI